MSTKIYINNYKEKENRFLKNWNNDPCKTCLTAWNNHTIGVDKQGEYVEFKSCKDDCPKYDLWIKSL